MATRLLCHLLVLAVIQGLIQALETKVAILSKMDVGDIEGKRELTLLPDTLNAELTTDGDVIPLALTRMENIDVSKTRIQFDQEEEQLFTDSKTVSFYQDLNNMAAIMVEAKVNGAQIQRTLTGSLWFNKKVYDLEPAASHLQDIDNILEEKGIGEKHAHMVHVLREVDSSHFLNADQGSIKSDFTAKDKTTKQLMSMLKGLDPEKIRAKRQANNQQTHFDIELMFIVDKSVYDYWLNTVGDNTKARKQIMYTYTQTLNGMFMAYRSIQRSDFQVTLWLKKIHVITDPSMEIVTPDLCFYSANKVKCAAGQALNKISNYLSTKKWGWNYMDHYAVFTKRDMWGKTKDGQYNANILGVALERLVCVPYKAISLNEDAGLITWATAAHELAHNLGSPHDPQGSAKYIMYYQDFPITSGVLSTAFTFSDLSVTSMKNNIFSKSYPRTCLFDRACLHHSDLTYTGKLPGQTYSKDQQCQLYYSNNKYLESTCSSYNTDICKTMYCSNDGNKCTGLNRGAVGTPCSTNNNMGCYNGQCVSLSSIQYIVYPLSSSCPSKNQTVPQGCTDLWNTCESDVINYPWFCFGSNGRYCTKTCQQNGLYWANNPPCGSSTAITCPVNQTLCKKDPSWYQCIYLNEVFNGVKNCIDGSDEDGAFIPSWCDTLPKRTCPAGKVNCPNCGFVCLQSNYLGYCPSGTNQSGSYKEDGNNTGEKSLIQNTLQRLRKVLGQLQGQNK